MKYKPETREFIKGGAAGLAALVFGCAQATKPAQTNRPAFTNNSASIRERNQRLSLPSYKIDEVRIGGEVYRAIPFESDHSAVLNGTTLNRDLLGNVILFPYSDHSVRLTKDGVTVTPHPDHQYVLTNVVDDKPKGPHNFKVNGGSNIERNRFV